MAYLIPCPRCQSTVPAELGMSGEQVTCQCGARVEVPMLRTLRDLPRDDRVQDLDAEWTWRHAVGVLGALIVVGGLALGCYQSWQRYNNDPYRIWTSRLENKKPWQVDRVWRVLFRDGLNGPLPGRDDDFKREYMEYQILINHYIEQGKGRRPWEYLGWAIAASGALMMAGMFFFPRGKLLGLPDLKGVEMTPGNTNRPNSKS